MAKDLGAWPRQCGLGQGGVAKVVEALPRPWARGQGLEGVVKAVRANPNPNPKAVGA